MEDKEVGMDILMDKIIMKNMAFHSYHGVFQEEKTLGQKFFIDASLYLDLKPAGINDDLNHSVNYGEVYELIKDIINKENFDLLEALAEKICHSIISNFNLIQKIELEIRKPEAPVHGIFDYFAVSINRKRSDYAK